MCWANDDYQAEQVIIRKCLIQPAALDGLLGGLLLPGMQRPHPVGMGEFFLQLLVTFVFNLLFTAHQSIFI